MVMEEERDGGGELVEELTHTQEGDEPSDVLQDLVGLVESVAQFGDYRRTQRKEACGLVRRMKLLLPLLEELRDLETPIPENAIASLLDLKKAFIFSKKLLKTCNEGSKIYLVIRTFSSTLVS